MAARILIENGPDHQRWLKQATPGASIAQNQPQGTTVPAGATSPEPQGSTGEKTP
jgi:hypothetical protein